MPLLCMTLSRIIGWNVCVYWCREELQKHCGSHTRSLFSHCAKILFHVCLFDPLAMNCIGSKTLLINSHHPATRHLLIKFKHLMALYQIRKTPLGCLSHDLLTRVDLVRDQVSSNGYSVETLSKHFTHFCSMPATDARFLASYA